METNCQFGRALLRTLITD